MRIDKATLNRWTKYVNLYLSEHNHSPVDITNKSQAWSIAYALDIPREAYHMDPGINDNHIETALRRIMPNISK